MKNNIQAYIYKGEKYYVAECTNISVVTQGKTLDETIANLREAVSLYIEGEDLAELGLLENPKLLIIMELETKASVA
jgi:predicted RNase H-like HicB family nuclease